MIILGVDPGSTIVGYGVIKKQKGQNQRFKVLDFGCITTTTAHSPAKRLEFIYNQINGLIEKHRPDVISVESLFFFKNLKTVHCWHHDK